MVVLRAMMRIQTFCDWLFKAAGKDTLILLLVKLEFPVVIVPVGVARVKLVGLSPKA